MERPVTLALHDSPNCAPSRATADEGVRGYTTLGRNSTFLVVIVTRTGGSTGRGYGLQ